VNLYCQKECKKEMLTPPRLVLPKSYSFLYLLHLLQQVISLVSSFFYDLPVEILLPSQWAVFDENHLSFVSLE
jgi:hypothetical protein